VEVDAVAAALAVGLIEEGDGPLLFADRFLAGLV